MEGTRFYSLLYIDEVNNINTNLRGSIDPIDVYVSCASLCSKTFGAAGAVFCVITNDESHVRRRLDVLQLHNVSIVSHVFRRSVPQNIPFYSAHFKLDIFEAFGHGVFGERIGLVDLDTVLFKRLPTTDQLAVYDISDQIFAVYDRRRIVSDMEMISGRHLPNARWYGGEFVMGSAATFRLASEYIELYWPNYIKNASTLSHIGDEIIVSSALNAACADGALINDYGEVGLVARWWTARTMHRQAAFDAVEAAALLHLPADKLFLAKEARYQFDPQGFLSRFRRHALKKIIPRVVVGLGESLLGRSTKFTPRLFS